MLTGSLLCKMLFVWHSLALVFCVGVGALVFLPGAIFIAAATAAAAGIPP